MIQTCCIVLIDHSVHCFLRYCALVLNHTVRISFSKIMKFKFQVEIDEEAGVFAKYLNSRALVGNVFPQTSSVMVETTVEIPVMNLISARVS
jgi:hypothetical protein